VVVESSGDLGPHASHGIPLEDQDSAGDDAATNGRGQLVQKADVEDGRSAPRDRAARLVGGRRRFVCPDPP